MKQVQDNSINFILPVLMETKAELSLSQKGRISVTRTNTPVAKALVASRVTTAL